MPLPSPKSRQQPCPAASDAPILPTDVPMKRARRSPAATAFPPATRQRCSALCPSSSKLKPTLQLDGEPGRRVLQLIVSSRNTDDFATLEEAASHHVPLVRSDSLCSLGSVGIRSGLVPMEIADLPSPAASGSRPCETPPCAPEAFERYELAAKCLAPKKP
eukprot:3462692-Prymnesium_polylepis.1